MGNYAVRIYDPALKTWLIAEAARRGTGIRTSDIVEAALRCYQTHIVHEGSHAASEEVSLPSRDSVRVRLASDRPAAPADAVSGEAVVQPVPALDPRARVVRLPDMDLKLEPAADPPPYEPVPREKGPDSGPDDNLGF